MASPDIQLWRASWFATAATSDVRVLYLAEELDIFLDLHQGLQK